mgnify:CR=1 FL=1
MKNLGIKHETFKTCLPDPNEFLGNFENGCGEVFTENFDK